MNDNVIPIRTDPPRPPGPTVFVYDPVSKRLVEYRNRFFAEFADVREDLILFYADLVPPKEMP